MGQNKSSIALEGAHEVFTKNKMLVYSIGVGLFILLYYLFSTTQIVMLPSSSMKSKLQGVWIGLTVLMIANIIRILSLVICNIYKPELFEFVHIEFWQIIFIFLGASLFLIWLNKYAYAFK